MANTRSWRHNAEISERPLAPLQKFIAFLIALEFQFDVLCKCIIGAREVGGQGMINNQIDRAQRVYFLRIAIEGDHRVTHGG